MTQTIKLKRTGTRGKLPTTANIALGEVAINTYDGRVFIKKDDGSDEIVEIGGTPFYPQSYYIDHTDFADNTGGSTTVNTWHIGDFYYSVSSVYTDKQAAALHLTLHMYDDHNGGFVKYHITGASADVEIIPIDEKFSSSCAQVSVVASSGVDTGWDVNGFSVYKAAIYVNSYYSGRKCPNVILDMLPGTDLEVDTDEATGDNNLFRVETDFTKTTRTVNSATDDPLRYRIYTEYNQETGDLNFKRNNVVIARIEDNGRILAKDDVVAYASMS